MQTINGAMRWLVVVMVLVGLGACSSEGGQSTDSTAADASPASDTGPAPNAVDAGARAPLVGAWCSSSYGELDLHADGSFVHTQPSGAVSTGTWASDGSTYLSFIDPDGAAGAQQTIVALTSGSLTLDGFSGTVLYSRCQ